MVVILSKVPTCETVCKKKRKKKKYNFINCISVTNTNEGIFIYTIAHSSN